MIVQPFHRMQFAGAGVDDADKMAILNLAATERILVLAPHPDDESLAAGGLIASVRQHQPRSDIRVIVVTNGDASYTTALFHGSHSFTKRHFWSIAEQRQQESLNALMVLGMHPAQIYFWGFPDRGLSLLRKNYWDGKDVYRSPTTGFSRAEQARNSPSFSYHGVNLLKLIRNELMVFKPTTIIFPHSSDAHPDHEALALLVLLAIGFEYDPQAFPQMLAYKIWSGNKFWLKGSRVDGMEATEFLENVSRTEIKRYPLPKPILEQKALALACYRSQDFAAGRILRTSAKNRQEIFTVYAPSILEVHR